MSNTPSDIVTFGKEYFYERSTKDIIRHPNGTGPEQRIARSSYTAIVQGRRRFSDDVLAVNILNDELEYSTIPDLEQLMPWWARVQVALPFIELIGKIRHTGPGTLDRDNFEAGAKLLFPMNSIDPVPGQTDYEAILSGLWNGLRCGLSHMGFMQSKTATSIDVQISHDGPSIVFATMHNEPVMEIGAKQFVDTVVRGLRDLIRDLRNDARLRNDRFFPLWRKRWGSYPP